jgi:hypothetical protein
VKIKEKHYPHPVLTYYGDDIIGSTFRVQAQPRIQNGEIKLYLNVQLENDDLQELLNNGNARYDAHLECSKTRFRRAFSFTNEQHVYPLPSEMVDGDLEVCFFITATTDMKNYTNTMFNDDYGQEVFSVKKYDVLAIAEGVIVPIKKTSNKQSIFEVTLDREKNAPPFQYDLESDKLKVILNRPNYDNFYRLSNGGKDQTRLLIMQTVFPVLIGVFEVLAMEEEGVISRYANYQWYSTLEEKLKEHNINILNADELAGKAAPLALTILSDKKDLYTETLEWMSEGN